MLKYDIGGPRTVIAKPELFGGKAYNLAKLEYTYKGIQVPRWICLEVGISRDVLAGKLEEANQLVYAGDFKGASASARQTILSCTVPVEVQEAICRFTLGFKHGTLFAVRSSAIEEDGATASFAGQYDSYLGINTDGVMYAILQCWASSYSIRSLSYRRAMNIDPIPNGMAVIIQQMIRPSLSGVAFSKDPTGNTFDTIIIEAIHGLGELLVSGEVEPTTFVLDNNSKQLLYKNVGKQGFRMGLRYNGGVRITRMKDTLINIPPNIITKLARILKTAESYLNNAVDIEWASKGSTLYILQARPMTALPQNIKGGSIGHGASPGIASGIGRMISISDRSYKDNILLAYTTNPSNLPSMLEAAGVVTAVGGITCHAAIVSREIGIPCIVGIGSKLLASLVDENITIDGSTATILVNE